MTLFHRSGIKKGRRRCPSGRAEQMKSIRKKFGLQIGYKRVSHFWFVRSPRVVTVTQALTSLFNEIILHRFLSFQDLFWNKLFSPTTRFSPDVPFYWISKDRIAFPILIKCLNHCFLLIFLSLILINRCDFCSISTVVGNGPLTEFTLPWSLRIHAYKLCKYLKRILVHWSLQFIVIRF